MEFISLLALVMLTLVGYSSGVSLAAGDREFPPAFWDLLLVAGLWSLAMFFRSDLGRWGAILTFIPIGIAVGFIATRLFKSGRPAADLPTSELPEHARELFSNSSKDFSDLTPIGPWRRAWQVWSDFALRMGNVQGRLIMGFFYFLIVTPFGLGFRLFADPLGLRSHLEGGWHGREPLDETIDIARKQG